MEGHLQLSYFDPMETDIKGIGHFHNTIGLPLSITGVPIGTLSGFITISYEQ